MSTPTETLTPGESRQQQGRKWDEADGVSLVDRKKLTQTFVSLVLEVREQGVCCLVSPEASLPGLQVLAGLCLSSSGPSECVCALISSYKDTSPAGVRHPYDLL